MATPTPSPSIHGDRRSIGWMLIITLLAFLALGLLLPVGVF